MTLSPRQHDRVVGTLECYVWGISGVCQGATVNSLRRRCAGAGEGYRPHVDYFNESGAEAREWMAELVGSAREPC